MNKYYEQKDLALLEMESYENLTLTNDFIFGKVMEDKELCTELLEMLTGNNIENIVSINNQKQVRITSDGKGVRYDIYVEDNKKKVYDAEMQKSGDRKELPTRARYYQGMIDLNILENGADYTKLKTSYVVFICTFDPFDDDFYCYRFENVCESGRKSLNDGRIILFYNTKGKKGNVTKGIKEFLYYIETGEAVNEYTKKLDLAVRSARMNKEWRVEYMKTLLHDMDVRNEGMEQHLVNLVKKKLEKGKDIATIAMEVEEDEERIKEIIEKL